MRNPIPTLFALALLLAGCAEVVSRDVDSRILAMGDSLLAWHGTARKSISHRVEDELGQPVVDRSVAGARLLYDLPVSGALGMKIAKQYRPGNWDWIILNGGGNDLWLGCACSFCDTKLDRLILPDASGGEIVTLINDLRKTGARVIYVGYLRSPGVGSPIEHCRDEGNELERRIARFAGRAEGVYFLSLADIVPHGDRSFHAADMIHPSLKASATIGQSIARIIQQE